MDPYQTARSLDDLSDFDGLLESYLGSALHSLHPPPQQPAQPQPQLQQHQPQQLHAHVHQRPGDPTSMLMPNGGAGGPMAGAPGLAGAPAMTGLPMQVTHAPATAMLGGMQQHAHVQPGTLGLGNMQAPAAAGAGIPGTAPAAAAFNPFGAFGATGLNPAGMGGLAALGAGLGGGLSQLDAFLGLQPGGGVGMAGAAGGLMQQRTSITTAAGLGMQSGGAPGAPQAPMMAGLGGMGLGAATAAGGMYGVPAASGLGAGMASAMAGGAAAGGGKSGGRRGRSGQQAAPRASRRSEPDQGSSDGELDSNSDSGSSDGDLPPNKSNKKKREGGGTAEDEAERRHAALQEKNRKAQRRFRERQKTKLMELHKQIEELAGKVSNLQTENAALHSRTSILEKVLDMRNEQIQVMQENKEVTEAELGSLGSSGQQALVQLTPEAIKEFTSEDIYRVYQTYVKELSMRLVEASKCAGGVPGCSGDAGAGDQAPATGDGNGGGAASGGAEGAVSGGGDGGSAAAEGAGSGGAGGAGAAGQPASASQAELERVVRELSVTLMRLGVARPLEARKFIVFSRQYLGNTEKEVIELWKSVMKHIELTPEQMREIVELKRMFLTKIEPIMEERKHLNISIQTNLPHDTFHTKSSISYIKAHEAVSKLRDNLRSEQHVVLEFAIAVFRGVFRPPQMAALLVRCYPAVPDALGIASALATELGEPDSPATQQLAMQLGGYAVPGVQAPGAPGSNPGLLSIHPSLMPMDANAGMGQQLLQQQQQAAQHLLQQQHLAPPSIQQQQAQQQQAQQQPLQAQQAMQHQQGAHGMGLGMGMGMGAGMGMYPGQAQAPGSMQPPPPQQQRPQQLGMQLHQAQQQQLLNHQAQMMMMQPGLHPQQHAQQQQQQQQQAQMGMQQATQQTMQHQQQLQQQQQAMGLQQSHLQQQQQQQQAGMYGVPSPQSNPDFAAMGLLGEMRARSGSISGSSAATPTLG